MKINYENIAVFLFTSRGEQLKLLYVTHSRDRKRGNPGIDQRPPGGRIYASDSITKTFLALQQHNRHQCPCEANDLAAS